MTQPTGTTASQKGQRVRARLRRRLPDRVRTALGGLYALMIYGGVSVLALGLTTVIGALHRIGMPAERAPIVIVANTALVVAAWLGTRGLLSRTAWGYPLSLIVGLVAIGAGVGIVAWVGSPASGVSGNRAFIIDVLAILYVLLGLVPVVALLRSIGWARGLSKVDAVTGEEVAVDFVVGPVSDGVEVAAGAPAVAPTKAATPLVTVRDLKKYFPIYGGLLKRQVGTVYAVDGVSFDVNRGETFSLVGESGCGKTTLGRTLLQLTPPTGGRVVFDGFQLEDVDLDDMRPFRRRMQIIFQDPFGSLNPRMPVSDLIGEGLLAQGVTDRKARDKRVEDTLELVGLRRDYTRRYPHEFSGGQRQRIGIARALAVDPDFVVCDEPVSALDVSIQSQILNLLLDLRRDLNLTYLFISHNLSVVEYFSDRVGVMYLGRIVELGTVDDLYHNPRHPYTVALLSAIPEPDPRVRKKRLVLKGDLPSPAAPPTGCHFHTRCWLREQLGNPERCVVEQPPLREVSPGHSTACHFAEDVSQGTVEQVVATQSVVDTAVADPV